MAEIERLVAVLEARVSGFEKNFAKAKAQADQDLGAIEKRAEVFSRKINAEFGIAGASAKGREADIAAYGKSLDALRAKYDPVFAASKRYESSLNGLNKALSVGAIDAKVHESALERLNAEYAALAITPNAVAGVGKGFVATSRNAQVLRGQTANLASQFQDIAVQLQSGTSPFTIALQQGTQINQVLGPLGVRGAVSALGGAFLSMINPVSLATLAIIATGGAAVQYFSSILSDGESSNQTIQKQQDLVRQIAKEWGDAVPALQAYVAELDRAKQISELGDATRTAIDNALVPLRENLPGIIEEIYQLNTGLLAVAGTGPIIENLNSSFDNLKKEVDAGTVTVEDFDAAQEAVIAALNAGIPAADALATRIGRLRTEFIAATGAAQRFASEQAAALAARQNEKNVAAINKMGPQLDPLGTLRPAPIAPAVAASPSRASNGGGGKSEAEREREQAQAAAERERKAVEDLIGTLLFEASLVGKTAEEKAAANAVRRAGAAATDEERQFIELATIALEQQRQAIEDNKQAMQEMQELTKGFLNEFISGIEQGKSVWEAFGDAALNVLNKIVDKLLDDVLSAIFEVSGAGGGGGILGVLGGLLGGGAGSSPLALAAIAGGGAGLYAGGGYTGPGSKYTPAGVVHAGEYVFDAQTVKKLGLSNLAALHAMAKKGYAEGGFVGSIPSISMPSRSAAPASYAPVYNIDARGAEKGVGEEIRRALAEYDKKVAPGTAVRAVSNARRHGVIQ